MAVTQQQLYDAIYPHTDTTFQASAAADKVLALLESLAPEAGREAYERGLAEGLKQAQAPRSTSAGEELDHFMDRMKLRGTRGFKGDFVASDGTRVHIEVEFERQQRAGQYPEFERG